jgi:hypothetical protein
MTLDYDRQEKVHNSSIDSNEVYLRQELHARVIKNTIFSYFSQYIH